MKKKGKNLLKAVRNFLLNPHLVICFLLGWVITNGWAYVALGIGTYYEYRWLIGIAAAYLAILWSPFCAEGILTFVIAIFLMQKLFPNDEKTLKIIKVYFRRYKSKLTHKVRKHSKKQKHKNQNSETVSAADSE